MEYQYPIDQDWSTEEIIDVIHFFQQVEEAYAKGVNREKFMTSYKRFKEIIPGKAQERKICDEFEDVSGFSTYRTVQEAKKIENGMTIRMKS